MRRLDPETYQITESDPEVPCDNCHEAGHPTVHILLDDDTEPTSICFWCLGAMTSVVKEFMEDTGHASD